MKSIKEKAEELSEKSIELSRQESLCYYQGLVEGANYVLKVVESILEDQELDVKETYYKIYETIKQLKK